MFWSKVETRGGRPNEQVNRIKTITRICKNHIFKRRHAAALPQFFTYTVSQLHSTHRGGSWSTDIQDGACQRSTLRSSLSQVTSFFFFLFFFRTTQKFTVTEGPYCDWESAAMLDCDPSSLESFPELAGYADSTLSRPLTGSPPGWGKDTRWGTNTYIAYRTVSLSCRRLFLFFSFLQICSQC